jgi:hypothetical protein
LIVHIEAAQTIEVLPRSEDFIENEPGTALKGKHVTFINYDWITANAANTHLATVRLFNDGDVVRVQELWEIKTGSVVWRHEQSSVTGSTIFPVLSPDGQYAGFRCDNSITLIDTSSPNLELKFDIPYELYDLQCFALGPGGMRFAIAVYRRIRKGVILLEPHK